MTRGILFNVGFMFVALFALLSYVYLSGQAPDDMGQIDFTPVFTTWGGKVGYVFIGVFVLFLVSHAMPYILQFRNWWVHTENHKVEIKKPNLWLGLLKRRYSQQ